MGTVVALLLFAVLAGVAWWVYLRTGARRWTTERDPLGEPPVRMAGLIAAIVIGVALASSGGGGTEHTSSMQQGLGDADDPAELPADRSIQSPGAGLAASGKAGAATADLAASTKAGAATGTATATGQGTATGSAGSPSVPYDRLVVRARKAAERRGAKTTWYPTLVGQAESASRQRAS